MSDIFPTLQGATWDVVRTPTWKTGYQEALSGKASALGYQQYPLWEWELHYSVLKDDAAHEIRQLVGFFNSMKGRYGTFRYLDPAFNAVSAEPFGTGDSVTNAFQLIANYAVVGVGSPDIIQNLASTPSLYDNAVLVNPANYSIGVTGIVTFLSPPTTGHALTWSGSFYYRCRFLTDNIDPSEFLYLLWELKSLKFRSVIL